MKVKRFVVPNMQLGLKQITEALGPDAVILSNKKLPQGLEIIAGVEPNQLAEYQRNQADAPAAVSTNTQGIIKANLSKSTPLDQSSMKALLQEMKPKNQAAFSASVSSASVTPLPKRPSPAKPASSEPQEQDRIAAASQKQQRELMSMMREEMDQLRQMLQRQTDALNHAPVEQSPKVERLESRLQNLGLGPSIQRSLMRHYDSDATLDDNWRRLMVRLASGVSAPLYDPLQEGGIIALCGPTGAGKTTTLTKLAAQYVKRYGAEGVTLVGADYFQLGAQQALAEASRILGVEFIAVQEKQSLNSILKPLVKRPLVLVDTSGCAQAIAQWRLEVAEHKLDHLLTTLIVMPATAHSASIEQFIHQFSAKGIKGAIVTKLDEALCFGNVFDGLLRHRWPLWYTTDGQNIPQDITKGDANALVQRLVQGLHQSQKILSKAG